MANFLKVNGRLKIEDPANLTPEQAKAVVDYAVERKKAGTFRTVHNSFEEQMQLIQNREVDVLECWEPAVKEAEKTMKNKAPVYLLRGRGRQEVGPWRLHPETGARSGQWRRHLQGAQLFPWRRVQGLSGA